MSATEPGAEAISALADEAAQNGAGTAEPPPSIKLRVAGLETRMNQLERRELTLALQLAAITFLVLVYAWRHRNR